MRQSTRALSLASAFALCAAAGAQAATDPVQIQFAAFSPAHADALPGDSVAWTNASQRTHTVTSNMGAFGSGDLVPGGQFACTAGPVGTYAYHCTIHPFMVGEVDVRAVTLDALPTAVVAPGARVELTGRTAARSQPVRIE